MGGADPQGVVGLLALAMSGIWAFGGSAMWLNTVCLLFSQAEPDFYPVKLVWNVLYLPPPFILIVFFLLCCN